MIAPIKKTYHSDSNATFITMLPAIYCYARYAFRHLRSEAKEEAVEEVIANAFVAFDRLVELNKIDLAYPSVLARYGASQIRTGRKVGTSQNNKDVLSARARLNNGHAVDRLDEWKEQLVEDRHSGPAEIAATRIDFADWLKTLSSRQRKIAKTLAVGEKTKAVARRFSITPGRVSQTRRELQRAWNEFVSDDEQRHTI